MRLVVGGTPYYYEYVPVACVNLAFFEGGRFIDNVNWLASHTEFQNDGGQ